MVRIARQAPNLWNMFVRVVIPPKEALVSWFRHLHIYERIRITMTCWIIINIKKEISINLSPDFRPYKLNPLEEPRPLQLGLDSNMPHLQSRLQCL